MTEDTALCFDAMGGLPGPYIKDFMGALGHDGTSRSVLSGYTSFDNVIRYKSDELQV